MSNGIEQVIFDVADALRVPVLILALAALAFVLYELGAFAFELLYRRSRDFGRLRRAVDNANEALNTGDTRLAEQAVGSVAWSKPMAATLRFIVDHCRARDAGDLISKALADFDFQSLRRLERTRILVRMGPALGLMGTLIPLAPALDGLAKGNTQELSSNLKVAFSVTVLGLLIGALAFAVSLVRDRLYGQDLSDLQFVASELVPES
jgi:biopolymer transport protein ExbB/TolQ